MAGEGISLEEFKSIPGQIGPRSGLLLLALQEAIVAWAGSYTYLEIGSYAGRSMHPHIRRPECTYALSVDLRPEIAHDERGPVLGYDRMTTEKMIANLKKMCGEDALKKLETITGTSYDLRKSELAYSFDLAFIDGEHTVRGVFTDFLNAFAVMKHNSIVAFDDTSIVFPAIEAAGAYLDQQGVKHKLVYARHNISFFQLGDYAERSVPIRPRQLSDVNAARHSYLDLIRESQSNT